MAEKIVSPGVFTRENDLSFLPQGISEIGAAIIGPTPKGPAFIPTLVTDYNDFVNKFGDADGKSYVPYTVKNYLANSGRATIVRVAGAEGYKSDVLTLNAKLSALSSTGSAISGYDLTALIALAPVTSVNNVTDDWKITFATMSMDFTLSSGSYSYSLSYNPSSPNYITNVFGKTPGGSQFFYVYNEFESKISDFYTKWYASSSLGVNAAFTSMSVAVVNDGIDVFKASPTDPDQYQLSSTPYIKSQTINGEQLSLFYFETFNHGASDVKISIEDVKDPSELPNSVKYGTFTVLVRAIDDTDARPNVLETFTGCTLDPTSPNYIARKIGDQWVEFATTDEGSKLVIHGDFPNNSKYVRVQMADGDIPAAALPFGYAAIDYAVNNVMNFPDLVTITTQKTNTGDWNYRSYLGFDFTNEGNMSVILKPITMVTVGTIDASPAFSLENCKHNDGAGNEVPFIPGLSITQVPLKSRKFSVPFVGGFDGIDPTITRKMGDDITATNVMGFDCSSPTSTGTLMFRKAIDAVSNPDEFDINMLVIPGLNMELHGSVLTYANTMCEDRQDTFFLFDVTALTSPISVAKSVVSSIDSNYSATYYPWVKVFDSNNNKYMWVPPSVVMAGVIAFNDRVAAEWFAPAGLNRGGISSALQVYSRLTQAERDDLYENRINPIAAFVGQGVVAWGQKTLQAKSSALDRINVRRLLIKIKKYIASTTKYLVFEQNTNATRLRFLNIVNPYLENIQQRQGLYTFKVVMDETNNTPDVIDRNQMKGEIYLQPAKTAEMIIIDFNITRTGATFGA